MRGAFVTIGIVLLIGGCEATETSQGARQPPPFPGSAGTTEWSRANEMPEGYGPNSAGFDSPEQLLNELVREHRAEATEAGLQLDAYLLGEDGVGNVIAALYLSGIADDSVAGDELRIAMHPAADGRWRIELLGWRTHCRRGVDRASDLCV